MSNPYSGGAPAPAPGGRSKYRRNKRDKRSQLVISDPVTPGPTRSKDELMRRDRERHEVLVIDRDGDREVILGKPKPTRKRSGTQATYRRVPNKPKRRKPLLYAANAQGVRTNAVTTGAGSQRAGQEYQVKTDGKGNWFHVYGHGAKAQRIPLSAARAREYGYIT